MCRFLAVALVVLGLLGEVLAACAAEPGGVGLQAEPEDPLAPPFLCVLPSGGTGGVDPEAYIRRALTAPNPGEELAIVTAPLGIRVARYPQQPASEPKEDDWYATHRQSVEPLLPVLQSLPKESLGPLCRGDVVVLTPYREALERQLAAVGFAGSNELPPDVRAAAVGIVAGLTVSPSVEVVSGPGSGAPTTGRFGMRFICDAQHYNFHGVQLSPDGSLAWEWKDATIAKRASPDPQWRMGSGWGERVAEGADIRAFAMDAEGAAVELAGLSGRTVGEVLGEALPAPPGGLAIDDALSVRRVFATGGQVSRRTVVDAIFCSAWVGLTGPGADGTRTLFSDPAGPWAMTFARRSEARRALDPDITSQVDEVFGAACDRPMLRALGIDPSRFAERWTGGWTDLRPEEAKWLADQLTAYATFGTRSSPLKKAVGEWAEHPEGLSVSVMYHYVLLIGYCVPWSTPGPGALDVTGAKPPPESYYTKLGAHTDLPMLSGRCARLTVY